MPSQSAILDRCTAAAPVHSLAAPDRLAPTIDELTRLAFSAHEVAVGHETARVRFVNNHLRQVGLQLPSKPFPIATGPSDAPEYLLNDPLRIVLSQYIRTTRPSLRQFVELWRHQTHADYRPNKALNPSVLQTLCKDYEHVDSLLAIARQGIAVRLVDGVVKPRDPPSNHPSAEERVNILVKNIRTEQDAGRCLVLDSDILEIWPEIVLSPFGVVNKGTADPRVSGRLIHDLSSPPRTSVNDMTDSSSVPRPCYQPPSRIAQEIHRVCTPAERDSAELLSGDVASAFRHCSIHSDSVYLFGGRIPSKQAIVIDLCAPFGWTLSPASYEIVGGAVSHVHGSTRPAPTAPQCFSYHWVDDHVCVATSHHAAVERSLRAAMILVLSASAINEEKFSGWEKRLKVLGLLFDTEAQTVSMPLDKIIKARDLVAKAHTTTSLSSSEYRSLLGSLRHVATCIRPARVFLQRMRQHESRLLRVHRVPVTPTMQQDLAWWWTILHDPGLNGVPLSHFGSLPAPDAMIVVDASDFGLCALDPAQRIAIIHTFTGDDAQAIASFKAGSKNHFDINFRELLSCAHAVHHLGDRWAQHDRTRPLHIQFRIDNTSAVSWQSKLHSSNPRAQTLVRLLGLWESRYNLRFSAVHVPGAANVIADLGSRLAQAPRKVPLFNSVLSDCSQVQTHLTTASFDSIWHAICASTPWPRPPLPNTASTSTGGSSFVLDLS